VYTDQNIIAKMDLRCGQVNVCQRTCRPRPQLLYGWLLY